MQQHKFIASVIESYLIYIVSIRETELNLNRLLRVNQVVKVINGPIAL